MHCNDQIRSGVSHHWPIVHWQSRHLFTDTFNFYIIKCDDLIITITLGHTATASCPQQPRCCCSPASAWTLALSSVPGAGEAASRCWWAGPCRGRGPSVKQVRHTYYGTGGTTVLQYMGYSVGSVGGRGSKGFKSVNDILGSQNITLR